MVHPESAARPPRSCCWRNPCENSDLLSFHKYVVLVLVSILLFELKTRECCRPLRHGPNIYAHPARSTTQCKVRYEETDSSGRFRKVVSRRVQTAVYVSEHFHLIPCVSRGRTSIWVIFSSIIVPLNTQWMDTWLCFRNFCGALYLHFALLV